ncbi:MAG TPA: YbjN domain-containing protein [Kofleriaceae bacterium]|jgi:hypothetical protein|nr:YbjN domain-containing protein [Kofleriaceae bacterium]
MQIESFHDLVKLLEREQVPHRVDEALQFVEIPTRSRPLEGSLAIVWDRNDNLVQFIHLLPFDLPAERLGAVAEAIARANHVLALPGFGIDHTKQRAYYRIVLPRGKDGSLDATLVGPTITSVVETTRDFFLPLQQIALHGAPPGDIVERARLGRANQH